MSPPLGSILKLCCLDCPSRILKEKSSDHLLLRLGKRCQPAGSTFSFWDLYFADLACRYPVDSMMKVLKEAATVCEREVPHPVKDKEDDICTVHLVLFANWLFLSFRLG